MSFSSQKGEQFASTYQAIDIDIGNTLSTFSPVVEQQPTDIITKLSHFTPGSIYEQLDEFSRTVLLYFANDMGLGMGWGIVGASLLLKTILLPMMVLSQVNAQKMKLLEPEMKNFQSVTQKCQQTGDYAKLKEAKIAFQQLREKHGLSNWIPFAMMLQMPILITWFLSIRYICSIPEKFPNIKTDTILWITDLSQQDPYIILPLLSATFSYLNIQNNPNMASMASNTIFSRYTRYFKFLPFVSLPFVIFFPAGLNLYWCTTAFIHMLLTLFIKSDACKKIFKIPQYLPGSIMERLNQRNQQTVIKSVINNAAPEAQQQDLNQKKKNTPEQQKIVELFTQKPKKFKK